MLYIQPDECVDCGACEPVCPVTAIFYEDDVPSEWKQFTPINGGFFSEAVSGIGSPGSAARDGPTGKKHPAAAARCKIIAVSGDDCAAEQRAPDIAGGCPRAAGSN